MVLKRKHPGAKPGEDFLCNVLCKEQFRTLLRIFKIPENNKIRVSETAYSLTGKKLKESVVGEGPFPVFVKKT